MAYTIDIPDDSNEAKALTELRATFKSDQEFASFLLTAASFYSEDSFIDMFETLEKRVGELERNAASKAVRTIGGRTVSAGKAM